jgi:hypothetical protein
MLIVKVFPVLRIADLHKRLQYTDDVKPICVGEASESCWKNFAKFPI